MAREAGSTVVFPAQVVGANDVSDYEFITENSRALEIWITVADLALGDFNFEWQSGIKTATLDDDADWVTVKSRNNVTANGTYVLLVVRETEALGERGRIKIIRNAGTANITVKVLSRED